MKSAEAWSPGPRARSPAATMWCSAGDGLSAAGFTGSSRPHDTTVPVRTSAIARCTRSGVRRLSAPRSSSVAPATPSLRLLEQLGGPSLGDAAHDGRRRASSMRLPSTPGAYSMNSTSRPSGSRQLQTLTIPARSRRLRLRHELDAARRQVLVGGLHVLGAQRDDARDAELDRDLGRRIQRRLQPLDQVEAGVQLAVADTEQRAPALRGRHAEVARDHARPDHVAVVAQHLEPDGRVEVERPLEVRRVDREVEDRLDLPAVGHLDSAPLRAELLDDVVDRPGEPLDVVGLDRRERSRCAAGCGRACGTARRRRCRWRAAPCASAAASTESSKSIVAVTWLRATASATNGVACGVAVGPAVERCRPTRRTGRPRTPARRWPSIHCSWWSSRKIVASAGVL